MSLCRWVVGLALLADTFPQERLAQAMGWVSVGMSLGILVAPLLGGVVYDRAGYNAVFGMAYGLVGLDIILRLLLVEKKVTMRWCPDAAGRQRPTDEEVTESQDNGEEAKNPTVQARREKISSPTVPASDLEKEAVTAASPSLHATAENPPPTTAKRRLRHRLPPVLSLLYSRRLLAALFGSIIQAAILTSFDSVLTIHAASTFHWTSTGAALLFLCVVIPSFLAPLFGALSDRHGGRLPAALGFLLAVPPLVSLRFVTENTLGDKVLLCALLALTGLTLTLTFPPFMAEISAVVAAKERKMVAKGEPGYGEGGAYAQAYALFNAAFAAGCMIGPLLAGFVVQERGWATMAWVLGLLSGVTAVPTFLYMGGFVFGEQ